MPQRSLLLLPLAGAPSLSRGATPAYDLTRTLAPRPLEPRDPRAPAGFRLPMSLTYRRISRQRCPPLCDLPVQTGPLLFEEHHCHELLESSGTTENPSRGSRSPEPTAAAKLRCPRGTVVRQIAL